MGTLLNRRRYMGGSSKEWTLKYWLSGEDAPVDGKWIDRLNPGIAWTLGSAVAYDAVNGRYHMLGRNNNGSCSLSGGYAKYNFGYHFRMVLQGTLNDQPNTNTGHLIDFASVVGTSASYEAAGWGCKSGAWIANYKLYGNSTGSLYNPTANESLPKPVNLPYDFIVEFGSEAVTNSTSRMYILFENNYYYGPEYTNLKIDNFQNKDFFIGRGYSGAAYGQDFYLNDWKIYVEQ